MASESKSRPAQVAGYSIPELPARVVGYSFTELPAPGGGLLYH